MMNSKPNRTEKTAKTNKSITKPATKPVAAPAVPETLEALVPKGVRAPTVRHTRPSSGATESAPTQPILQSLGVDEASLQQDVLRHLSYTLGRDAHSVNDRYRYQATVLATRDRLMERWKNTHAAYYDADCKRAYYMSMEFLMGRALGNAVLNLGVQDTLSEALSGLGMKLEELAEQEPDAGLGNGGLGRLAACFLDSCATLQLPVVGYGIRYDYGMFRQRLVNGQQIEEPDHWLAFGSPWELCRPEYSQRVHFGGQTESYVDPAGQVRWRWIGTTDVLAVPYDVPVPGYRNGTVNTLRLWRANSPDGFDLGRFNAGDYDAAIDSQAEAENISRVLYPNDKSQNGKQLRLRQQYFLASSSLKDIVRRWTSRHGEDFSEFAAKNICQLNDTHPTVAVAELMRLLMDEHGLGWDEAWGITTRCMAYTNHTLLPEALEKWPVALFRQLLPRVLDIIFEINARFLRLVANTWPGDGERQARMSIIEEGRHPQVRMAFLAIVGSCSVNGVAQLHSDLLRDGLLKDFAELWPERFNNKTNGVTQRRWLAMCNPTLSELITDSVGPSWVTDLAAIAPLSKRSDDAGFRSAWRAARRDNKVQLAAIIKRDCGVEFSPDALFDVQVKRIHEYKRQLLNALHVVHLYDRIKRGDGAGLVPRCVLFGGKAAPGYQMAKTIIRFITSIADVVNNDRAVGGLLKVAYIPDYRVSLMERICPAADLSEQISTAGKEASGTGNMKFMMNGALTIGTLDGANIEMREEVSRHGDQHFFLFGATEPELASLRAGYKPEAAIAACDDLKRVLELIRVGHFSQCAPGAFDDILASLTSWGDYWYTCGDFADYLRAQRAVEKAWSDQTNWTKSSILNSASSGKFSTDRTMREYNRDIWKLNPVKPFPV